MSNKKSLEFVRKDRTARNEDFQRKLEEEIGLILYGWNGDRNGVPYVRIGDSLIWLMEECTEDLSGRLVYRKQSDVLREIELAISDEVEKAKQEDQEVEDYFARLSK